MYNIHKWGMLRKINVKILKTLGFVFRAIID